MASGFHLPKSRDTTAQQQNDLEAERDRSRRSVFVGNIPYEATDENLREIFSQAGPVLSFRLVYDRESGKPKGYGFCEYKDLETAQSAMRNLNGVELHGRNLRVDSAASEKNKEEVKDVKSEVSPYGAEIAHEDAPEAISQAVASLPPEQMFELMKQMKMCIQNNPDEARQMLLQNPQLAYALLQAQVIMKIVDPKVAYSLLHQPRGEPLSLGNMGGPPTSGMMPSSSGAPVSGPGPLPVSSGPSPLMGANMRSRGPGDMPMGPPDGWRPSDDMRPDMERELRGPMMDVRGPPGPDIRGPPGSEMMDRREFRGPPMDRDEIRMRDMRGPPPDEFREFREERFREFGGPGGPPGGPPGPPFDVREREMREGGRPMMERGPPMDPRDRGQAMEPRDPRMRGEGPPGPRNPMEQRGPPDSRGPGDMRGPPDSRDSWPPPERRMPGDPRGAPDARGPPRDERMMRDSRGPPPTSMRETRESPIDPRAQGARRPEVREQRGGPPFERWNGPPDPRGIPPEHRGPPGERRPMPPDNRGPPMPSEGRGPPMPPDSRGQPMLPDSRGPPMPPDSRGPPMSTDSRGPPLPPDNRGPPPPGRGPQPPPEQRNDPRFRPGPPGPDQENFFEGRPNPQGTPTDGPPRGLNPPGPGGNKPPGPIDENIPFSRPPQWQ